MDGCPGGWVGALVLGTSVRWLLLPDAEAVCAVRAAAVGIDIPIGLTHSGPRRCDLLARQRLGARRSSVFPAPVRAVLDATSYADARSRSRVASGRGLSVQTWNICDRIADVDRTVREHDRVVEVHPELVFAFLAGALPSKKQPIGRAHRERALRGWLPAGWPPAPKPARPDDALDALACAWTARRWLSGRAEVLGGELDDRGIPMRIVV